MPFVKLYEQLKYGNYASNTVMDGFLASKEPNMVTISITKNKRMIHDFTLFALKIKDIIMSITI